jgi:hypothetical protein
MDVSGQLHTPASLLPGKNAQVPIHQKLGGLQSRSGHCEEEKIILYMPKTEQCLVVQPALPIHYTDWALLDRLF